MPELKPVWSQIEDYLKQGLSIIPVRQREERTPAGKLLVKKSPYDKWKRFQYERVSKEELFHQMDEKDTQSVAVICGKVSGNLEVIDIDVKWYPGADALLFKDIQTLYPDIFNRLRIHRSPSGGYHIIYRVTGGEVPGNQKLARRPSTEKELETHKEKQKCFFETRGEGGYILFPPSEGYTVHADHAIPTLTWAERTALINLAKLRDQEVKVEKAPTVPHGNNNDYYDVNPFVHFNQSPAAEDVLLQHGWRPAGESGDYVHYTRPGDDKNGGISASFIRSKRIFYIFTTNSDLDSERGYQPATALGQLAYQGDMKRTFRELVQMGYGKIKPTAEAAIAKRSAIAGRPLPANASDDARKLQADLVAALDAAHPHGIFWEQNDESKWQISRENLYNVAAGLGFRHYNQGIVRVQGFFIHRQTDREFYDALKAYVREEDANLYTAICNAYESFIQKSGTFTITRIQQLDEAAIIRDTATTSYKFYQNGYVYITGQEYSLNAYENIAGLIWHHLVQDRLFVYDPAATGRYQEFLALACGNNDYTRRIIGYLTHAFKDETTGYIVVLTEECPDPKQGGGSGKNIWGKLLSYSTTYKSIPGAQVKLDEKFLQSWNYERVFCLSDIPKRFDFGFLKEMSTGDGLLKKLFKDEAVIPVDQMPKFVILTNYSYEVTDGGLKRRIIPLEFTNYFTNAGGVDVHFGVHFPGGWTAADWTAYDNYIAGSIQIWLAGGSKLQAPELSRGGWHKQFEQTYGAVVLGIIEEYWGAWVELGHVTNPIMKQQLDIYFRENNIPPAYQPAMQKLTAGIRAWALHNGQEFQADLAKKIDGITVKYKWFGSEGTTPF